MKELAKASEDEKPTSSDKKNHHSEVEVLFIEELNTFAIEQNAIVFDNKNTSVYSNLYSRLSCKTFFHPPSFIS